MNKTNWTDKEKDNFKSSMERFKSAIELECKKKGQGKVIYIDFKQKKKIKKVA